MAMPYDEGWTVTVDGEEIEWIEHSSHWMMFAVPKGDHEIEMRYFPQGLKEGIFVSAATVLVLLLFVLLSKMREMRLAEESQETAEDTQSQNPTETTVAGVPEETGENAPKAAE